LDEECRFPKASDITLLEKLHKNFEKTKRYEKPKLSKIDFGIEHFAGKVTYNVTGFLDKNKDTLQDDLRDVCISSTLPLVKALFVEQQAAVDAVGGSQKKAALTVGAQFRYSVSFSVANC
jgi:myosin heavy subunit